MSSAAVTDESTPPESPQMTRESPMRSRISVTVRAMKADIFHNPRQPQISKAKFRRMVMPAGVCVTSG
jgi:hypothetical protein